MIDAIGVQNAGLPKVATMYGFDICDLVLILGAATSRMNYLNEAVCTAICNGGVIHPDFAATIDSVFMPNTTMAKVEAMTSKDNSKWYLDDDDEVKVVPDYRKKKFTPFQFNLGEARDLKMKWWSLKADMSPNASSLFQAITLLRNQFKKPVYTVSPSQASGGNIRNVEVVRVFNRKNTTSGNPGIMGGLLGLSTSDYHKSIVQLKYMMWPYTLLPGSEFVTTSYPLVVRTVFAHAQLSSKATEPGHVIAGDISIQDAAALVDLFAKVSVCRLCIWLVHVGSKPL